jgi:hypothetical protein
MSSVGRIDEMMKLGDKVSVKGREFTVVNAIEPGPATKTATPSVMQQLVLAGPRGAHKLVYVYASGEIREIA